jgi:hypothetical protein
LKSGRGVTEEILTRRNQAIGNTTEKVAPNFAAAISKLKLCASAKYAQLTKQGRQAESN